MQNSTRVTGACCPRQQFNATTLALRGQSLRCKLSSRASQASGIAACTWPRHAQRLPRTAEAAAAVVPTSPQHLHRTTTTTAAAASQTNSSAAAAAAAAAAHSSPQCTGRAVVVGGGPAGLAAAIGLARQAGFRVDVFDARQNPASDSHSSKEALLVALGARGLQALSDLHIPLTTPQQQPPASRSSSPLPNPSPGSRSTSPTPTTTPGSSSSSSSSGTILTPDAAAAAPRDLGAASGIATASYLEDAAAISGLLGGVKPPTGLTLLQGMLLLGPGRMRRLETYGRPAAAAAGGAAAAASTGLEVPAGIAVMDSHTLTATLLAEAAATEQPRPAAPSIVLPAAAAAAAAAAPASTAAGSDSSSSSIDLAAASPGVRCHYGCELLMVDTANRQATFIAPDGAAVVVPYDILIGAEPGSGSHLVADALAQVQLRQLPHKHANPAPTGSSSSKANATSPDQHQAIYGSLAAAAASGGAKAAAVAATAVGAAQQDASTSASGSSSSSSSKAAAAAAVDAAGFVELEFKSWADMPHQRELRGLLPAGSEALQASLEEVGQHHKHAPGKGWLLVWTGTAGSSAAQPFPTTLTPDTPQPEKATWVVDTSQAPSSTTSSSSSSSSSMPAGTGNASGSGGARTAAAQPAAAAAVLKGGAGSGATLMFPGGPSCTLMAWPSRGGGSWSGAVFTAPQVFESLRSQADYEGLLKGLRAAGGSGSALPGLWVKGIAAQLRSKGQRVGRVLAPWLPPPPHLAAPAAGLLLLSPAAALTSSPQMLCPAASLGLQDAAVLAAAVAAALPKGSAAGNGLWVPGSAAPAGAGGGGGSGSEQLHRHVEQALKHFDKMRQPEVAALQRLQAQLSYLRHPFSPAAPAALAATPPASLAWLASLFGKARAGLALQWRCLAAVLPLVAAVLKAAYSDGSTSSKSAAGTVSSSSAAAAASAAAQGLTSVLQAVRPSGASLMAFLHTTGVPYRGVWALLHWAPLLLGLAWGAMIWAAVQAVRWAVLAYRVWGVSWAGA